VGVAGLAVRGLLEVAGHFGVALDIGDLGEVEVAAVGLGLAGEGGLQVFVGLGAFEVCHRALLGNGGHGPPVGKSMARAVPEFYSFEKYRKEKNRTPGNHRNAGYFR
jgi:hypothetical protein